MRDPFHAALGLAGLVVCEPRPKIGGAQHFVGGQQARVVVRIDDNRDRLAFLGDRHRFSADDLEDFGEAWAGLVDGNGGLVHGYIMHESLNIPEVMGWPSWR